MAVPTNISFALSLASVLILIALMQMYKANLASTQLLTIVGGFLGSMVFVLLTTTIGNLEKLLFGYGFQVKLVPELSFSLLVAMVVSGSVHRVCVTTCVLFSLLGLYYMNKISQSVYGVTVTAATQIKKKK